MGFFIKEDILSEEKFLINIICTIFPFLEHCVIGGAAFKPPLKEGNTYM